MNFDPTIRLDFIVVAASIATFVIRLQSQIARTGVLLDKLEARVHENEVRTEANQRLLDRHLGAASEVSDG